ncbi:MAG: SDR family oxidoreductase [Deltaproteobacteria bacterium]|nr:SDR family oxidoreductase [Deltaproteobacteria bacterium]
MNKTIFVTGAASGIGKETALLFGRRGYRVGCYDVDVEGAAKVAAEISSASHGRIDVTSEESWRTAVADFTASSGERLDVLFNCAGILRMGRFEDVAPAECRKQLEVNVMGVVLGVQTCLPLLERSRGVIVNMSSASAIYGQPELAVYSATKFAVRALTEALDIELRDRGVRVADVMPGYVDTPMVSSQAHRATSLQKMGVKLKPEKIAEIVWEAAHGTKLHYIPQADLRLMQRVGGLVPELGRAVMRKIASR